MNFPLNEDRPRNQRSPISERGPLNPLSLISEWNTYDEEGKRRLATRMVVKLMEEYEGALEFNPNLGLTFDQWILNLPGLNQDGYEEVRSFVIDAYEQSV